MNEPGPGADLRRAGRWHLAGWAVGAFGGVTLAGGIWDAVIEHEWWHLVLLPVWVLFYFWVVMGCFRRAQAPGEAA